MKNYFSFAIACVLVVGCGVKNGPHYDGSKNFGRHPNSNSAPVTGTQTGPIPNTSPAPTTVTPNDPLPPDEPTTSGHDLMNNFGLIGYFTTEQSDGTGHFKIISTTEDGTHGRVSDLLQPCDWLICAPYNFAVEQIKRRIIGPLLEQPNSTETLDIQTIENGHDRLDVKQTAHTEIGDSLAHTKGDTSTQSGALTVHWLLAKPDQTRDCPANFICMDRLTWQPEVGETQTFCYYDAVLDNQNFEADAQFPGYKLDESKPRAIPYSPNPEKSKEDIWKAIQEGAPNAERHERTSGPIAVRIYKGDVQCGDPAATAERTELLTWRVSMPKTVDTEAATLHHAFHDPISADFQVTVTQQPYSKTDRAGYQMGRAEDLQILAHLNTSMTFFLNSTKNVFTKISRLVQSDLQPSFLTTIADYLTWRNLAGLELEYNFEFCQFKAIKSDHINHCTGETIP